MRYIVKKETTGSNGWCQRYRHVDILRHYDSLNEALDELEAKRLQLTAPKFKGTIFGSTQDFTIILDTKAGPNIIRYWVEKEAEYHDMYYYLW